MRGRVLGQMVAAGKAPAALRAFVGSRASMGSASVPRQVPAVVEPEPALVAAVSSLVRVRSDVSPPRMRLDALPAELADDVLLLVDGKFDRRRPRVGRRLRRVLISGPFSGKADVFFG